MSNEYASQVYRRSARGQRAFSARAIQAKSLWPAPVIDATVEDGRRYRLSFHSPADRLDTAHARALVETFAKCRVVDATYWHQGEQIEVLADAPKRRRSTPLAQLAAIANDPSADPAAALAQIRALLAA